MMVVSTMLLTTSAQPLQSVNPRTDVVGELIADALVLVDPDQTLQLVEDTIIKHDGPVHILGTIVVGRDDSGRGYDLTIEAQESITLAGTIRMADALPAAPKEGTGIVQGNAGPDAGTLGFLANGLGSQIDLLPAALIEMGDGGKGGKAYAEGPGSAARGGRGGHGGVLTLQADEISFQASLRLGNGGDGGESLTVGANAGGYANPPASRGGDGGLASTLTLPVHLSSPLLDQIFAVLNLQEECRSGSGGTDWNVGSDGAGGADGAAPDDDLDLIYGEQGEVGTNGSRGDDGEPATGGNGDPATRGCSGGHGGHAISQGGKGGGGGNGGDGGDAVISGGRGGDGAAGGNGGDGGTARGGHGGWGGMVSAHFPCEPGGNGGNAKSIGGDAGDGGHGGDGGDAVFPGPGGAGGNTDPIWVGVPGEGSTDVKGGKKGPSECFGTETDGVGTTENGLPGNPGEPGSKGYFVIDLNTLEPGQCDPHIRECLDDILEQISTT